MAAPVEQSIARQTRQLSSSFPSYSANGTSSKLLSPAVLPTVTNAAAVSSSSSLTSSPLYVPPPSAALPSSSPYLPSTLRATPGQTLTIEGSDNRRHTYNDQGVELGNGPAHRLLRGGGR